MKCPKCGKELLCGGQCCIDKNAQKIDHEHSLILWLSDGYLQICANCGLCMHCDEWLNVEAKQKNDIQQKSN